MGDYVIRAAQAADIDHIVRLVGDLAEFIGDRSRARVTGPTLAKALDGPSQHCCAVVACRADGRVIGTCLYALLFSTWRNMPGLYVIDLFVEPAERSSGVGRALLAAAAREGVGRGCGFIRLDVDRANPSAVGFYERIGFVRMVEDQPFVLAGQEFQRLIGSAA